MLKFIRNKSTKKVVLKYWKILIVFTLFLSFLYFLTLKTWADLPSPTKLSSLSNSQSTQIYDRNDKLLYSIYIDKNQTFVPLSTIPKTVQQASIAIEDKDFYRHGAIDIRGIARALYSIVFHKQLQGGSTITQQLVKNSLLTPERTITRKIKEVILSFVTEVIYPKNKILEMYLNQTPYGGTAWGIETASLTYFGKHAKDLNLAQSALLAGLPEAPTLFSPNGAHPELAKKRQEEVLRKMYEQGYISKEKMNQAIKEPLQYQKLSNNIKAPHFVLYVKDLLVKKYGPQFIEQGGFKVKTSLDLDIQEYAQATVAAEIAKIKDYHVSNGAALITNPKTGEILAMVGSKDYFDPEIDGNVNVTLAMRQPGSSIKPINYVVGLVNGYTAATPFVDQKICFPNAGHPEYCPVNYDGKFHGIIQFRQALGNSINIPAVKLLKLNGVSNMIATASAMGISTFESPDKYGLSLTLGGGEITMTDMATAYGVFANQGYRIDLHPILKITDNKGTVIEEYNPPQSPIFGKKVLPPGAAFIISHILLDNNAREIEFGLNSELKINDLPVSVKTGTTNDFRDNWTIGYTPSYLVAVWVGNNDNSAMGGLVSGITGAAPIWHKLMANLLKDKKPEWPQKPDDVIGMSVCNASGLLPAKDNPCPTRFEYFLIGTQPKTIDPGKQKVWIDKTTNDLAKPGQTDNVEEKEEVIITDPTGDRYCLTCPHPQPTLTP
ncbi:penicillin-binding protein [Candidatus Microgenomates bacterium]|nr:MAG: penicillin-binding protein [Candidatus Microgenomates bacterium]